MSVTDLIAYKKAKEIEANCVALGDTRESFDTWYNFVVVMRKYEHEKASLKKANRKKKDIRSLFTGN